MENKVYRIKRRLSKTKVLGMIRDHMGGLQDLKFSDFTFKELRGFYLVKFYQNGRFIEVWFHHWCGRVGFRVDHWCYLDEYDDQLTFIESQFCHVSLDYLVKHGLVEEVAA